MIKVKRFLSVVLSLAMLLSGGMFSATAQAAATDDIEIIWEEDFNTNDENYKQTSFFPSEVQVVANNNGTGTVTVWNWSALYSRGYEVPGKYIVEYKIDSLSVPAGKSFNIGTAGVVCSDRILYNAGIYHVVVDKDNGVVSFYNNDGSKFDTDKTNVTNFGDGEAVHINGNEGSAVFDSITAYRVKNDVKITVDSVKTSELEITASAPIDPATAVISAVDEGGNKTSATVETISIYDRKYRLVFAEALSYGENYSLEITTLNGLEGTALTANAPQFTTEAYQMPEYIAPTPFFVENSSATNEYTKAYEAGSPVLSITRENGYTTFAANTPTGGEFILSTPSVTSSNKYYIEYEVSGLTYSKYFQVFPGGYYNGTAVKQTGKFYGVYNGSSYKVYKDDAVLYEVTSTNATPPETSDMIGINFNGAVEFNYIVAYPMSEDMSVKITESNDSGVTFKTTMPINTSSSVAKVGGTQLTISTVSGQHLTYKAEFPAGLTDNIAEKGELSLTLKKLNGTLVLPESTFEFTLPVLDSSTPFFVENAEAVNEYTIDYKSSNAEFSLKRENGHSIMASANGETVVTTPIAPTKGKYYIEYEVVEKTMYKDLKIYPYGYYYESKDTSDNGALMLSCIRAMKGNYYGVFDSATGTYDVYYNNNGEVTKFITKTGTPGENPDELGIDLNSEAKLAYIVAYPGAKTMTAEVTGSDASGVTFKTTMPINTSTSVATVNGKKLAIKPVSGQWCTFKAYFDETTDVVAGENTLKLTLTKLDNAAAMAETEFKFTLDSEATITNATTSEADGKICGAVRVLNTTDSDYTFTCIVASYTNEGKKLDDVKVEEITVPAGKAGVFKTTKAVDAKDTNTYSYSVFVWQNMSNLIPIAY